MQTSAAQSSNVQTSAIFRTWLAFGLAANLVASNLAASHSEPTLFGPAWLWLIAIPLAAYSLTNLPNVLRTIVRNAERAWRLRARPQAIRVRR